MSGVTGAERVKSRADYERFIASYLPLIKQFPGFVSLKKSGSFNSDPNKQDFGDIDLIAHIQSDKDKPSTKKELVNFFHSQPDTTIVPFTSVKHTGKRSYNSGEIVTVRYHDSEMGYSVQIDNIIASDEREVSFKTHFLDMPAEKQGLILGLVKIAAIETDPADLFKRLNINAAVDTEQDQEYEFNLSGVKLELRKVTYEPGTFKQADREIVWTSQDWLDVEKLLYQYDLSKSFDELIARTKQIIKNPRSNNRLQGVFSSMVSVKSGEVGTAKGAGKEAALDKITKAFSESKNQSRLLNALMEDEGSTIVFAFGRFQPPTVGHQLLVDKVKETAEKYKAPYVIFVSKTVGITSAPKLKNPLTIDQKLPYVKMAFPGVNFLPCSENMVTVIDVAKYLNTKYQNIVMVAGQDRLEGDWGFHTVLPQQNGIDYNFNSIKFESIGRDPDAESGTKVREAAQTGNWERFRLGIPSTIDDAYAKQLMDDVAQGMAPVARKKPQKKEKDMPQLRELFSPNKTIKEDIKSSQALPMRYYDGLYIENSAEGPILYGVDLERHGESGILGWFDFAANLQTGQFKITGNRANSNSREEMDDYYGEIDDSVKEIIADVRQKWGTTWDEIDSELNGGFGVDEGRVMIDPPKYIDVFVAWLDKGQHHKKILAKGIPYKAFDALVDKLTQKHKWPRGSEFGYIPVEKGPGGVSTHPKEDGYGDNGSPESRRSSVGSASYVSMPAGVGIKEAMLPKSSFASSKKNKLGPAGQLKGNMKRAAHAGDLVGGGCEESVAEEKQRLDPHCWKGYRKAGTKMKGGKRVNNCVPVSEDIEQLMAGYIKILESK